jgi:two-component system, chemotaxis family, sensor kinase CheA
MASELEALWTEFAAESEEHLDALERLLSEQRKSDWNRDEIGALFRYFHSLKGTFLAMGFGNVEAVAHRCEDVLSLVRSGSAPLDRPLVQVLLRAVDRLKGMREDVVASRKDAKPANDILRELEAHGATQRAEAAPVSAPPSADTPLSEDPDMLAIYSELLEQRLPQLAGLVSADPQQRAAAVEAADTLAYGAEMMGFEALAESLHAARELSAEDASARELLVQRFGALREQIKVIEEATGVTSGAGAFARALAEPLGPDYAASLDRVAVAVAVLEPESVEADAASPVVAAAESARAIASCLGFDESALLLLFTAERFRDRATLDAPRLAICRALAQDTLEVLQSSATALADVDTQRSTELAARWQASFQPPEAPGAAAAAVEHQLRPEMLVTLSQEQRGRLEQAIAEGRRAFEVLLDLEAHRDVADDIIAWLSTSVETITSRTVFRDGAACFEFLILAEHDLNWVSSQLAALDPERACLRGIEELSRASEASAEQVSSASARAPLIRVRSETIDELMAEVGEMRTDLARLADLLQHGRIAKAMEESRRASSGRGGNAPIHAAFDAMEDDLRELRDLQQTLEAAHRRIWTAGLQLRVVPIDGLFSRLSRAARDLAEKLGKDIDVAIEGREVRIDKSMVDGLIDPLMHMVRNAIDHGIETPERRRALAKPPRARIVISASERGNHIDIVIADDGQGLDRNRILAKALDLGIIGPHQAEQMADRDVNALIFHPGFSTADAITEISGRGVGLDVVAATLHRLGGTIDVQTIPAAGTKFILKLPLSASLLRALLVDVEGQIFALPERQVMSVLELEKTAIERAGSQDVVLYRGAAVPVHELAAALGFEPREKKSDLVHVVIVSTGTETFGFRVDRVLRFQDLFLKELHPMLAASALIGGASVLGDGRPILVLEARGFAALGFTDGGEPTRTDAET